MRRWHKNVIKRPLRRRSKVVSFLTSSGVAPEERLLFERELQESERHFFRSDYTPILDLSHSFYPFAVVVLQASKSCSTSLEAMWPLFLMAMHVTDVSLNLSDARLFGPTSEMGCRCVEFVRETLKENQLSPGFDNERYGYMRLVMLLVTQSLSSPEEEEWVKLTTSTVKVFQQLIPCHILQLLLSVRVAPSVIFCVINSELSKYGERGINHHFFSACIKGLSANDYFFSPSHFHEMNAILTAIVDKIGVSFDYHSVRWTPLLNKLSRIYMRQCQGEALAELHFKLLAALPALETKLPLPYLVHCIGSLVDAGALKDDSRSVWQTITTMASLAVRLYGSVAENLRTIWLPFLKAAITLRPHCLEFARVIEAYHLCASLGHSIVLDKTAFSQVVRLLVNTLIGLPIEETRVNLHNFYRFLLEHPSINFLWVTDSLVTILNGLWRAHGDDASQLVHSLMKDLQVDYFPSMRLSGIHLGDNPAIRRFLEKFRVVGKADFWWCCGCGTQLPASAKRCLTCLRGRNVSWTCTTCGAGHVDVNVTKECVCGSANPRTHDAARAGIHLCVDCGDVLSSSVVECAKCGAASLERQGTRECSFCGISYSQGAVCCPRCYTANEEKQPMLWRCDACGEYSQWTWSKCQRCPARRRVGCIVTPLEPWVCGCGKQNHPCRTGCEICSRVRHGAYTCDSCGVLSNTHATLHFSVHTTKLRLILCQDCGHVHPRDRNVLGSPFLRRHCHQCGSEYIRANLSSEKRCTFCNAFLCYNELIPFTCTHCELKSHQNGFHCVSCRVPREDVAADDVYVWRCLREVSHTLKTTEPSICGGWNYSWQSFCATCGEARAKSRHECRARFIPWLCAECHQNNLPTDVIFCPQCDEGLQEVHDCPICGLAHLSLDCDAGVALLVGAS